MNDKLTEQHYKNIELLLKKEHPSLLPVFSQKKTSETTKEVFIWLDYELKKVNCSKELNELMTNFFYSIH